MTQSRYYSNIAVANSIGNAGGISNSATSVFCTTAPAGYPTQFPFTLTLDPGTGSLELVTVTSGAGTAGNPWVIVRAYDGTTAASHANGAVIQHSLSANDETTSRLHESSSAGSGVHGLPSSAWATAPLAVISEQVLNNSTTSAVTFSSIPSVYSHLLIIALGRLTENTVLTDWVNLQINSDTGAHYSYVQMACTNTSGSLVAPADATSFSGTSIPLLRFAASQGGSAVNAGSGFAFLPWYASTVFNKNVHCMSGAGNGTSSMVDGELIWGFWNPASQAAISTLSLSAPSGFFVTGSSFGLYGLS